MWRILGTLACMLVCGVATLFVTIVVMMDLGTKHHGNYEYYGINYPALVWGPAVLCFLAPGVLVWYLARRGYTHVWKIFGTLPLMVCNVGVVMLVLHYSIGLAKRFQTIDDYRWLAVEVWGSYIAAFFGFLGVAVAIWYLEKRGDSSARRVSRTLSLMLVSEVIVCIAAVLLISMVRFSNEAAELNAEQQQAIAEIQKLGGEVYYREKGLCVNFYDTQIANAELVHLSSLTSVVELVLAGTEITDAGLGHLEYLTSLKSLSLSNTKVTDIGLANLQGLSGLQDLYLFGTQITDEGLAHLQGFVELQLLDLSGTQITNEGLAHLQGFVELQYLHLSDTGVSDDGLVHLTGLTSLRGLILGGNQITDAGLIPLKKLTQLNRVSLRNTQVTDAGLVHLKVLNDLRWLDLNQTQVTEKGVEELQEAIPNCEIPRFFQSWSKVK